MAAPRVDFGKAAQSYGRHRQGFPPAFFDRLEGLGVRFAGKTALDLGTGTGLFARAIAERGATVTGVDPSPSLLEQARAAEAPGAPIRYLEATAERTGLPDASFDLVSAATCWHWFDRAAALRETVRVMTADGVLIICHLDWRRGPTGVIELTSRICRQFNPASGSALGANTFQYPAWLGEVRAAGFGRIELFGHDVTLAYSHESWVERVKASASIGPALPPAEVARFGETLADELRALHPAEPIPVEHFAFCVVAWRAP